ncbi:hypothetical protein [Sporohalobacter salinus]|uniref:hypothetical protein n=1 Tax=Sporohalobacter salinus TaxID=1494606 RepID=UPI00195FEED0|nr:hypothetical protein [Sporohalobacter salinus]MBM7625001.1 ribosomal protein L20A (L18A) [Sporohalobacter salinus]
MKKQQNHSKIKAKNKNIHNLTKEILTNIDIKQSTTKYSEAYEKIYNLLSKKYKIEFNPVNYGC